MIRYLLLLLPFSYFLFPFYLKILPEVVWTFSYYTIIIVYITINYKLFLSFLSNVYPYRKHIFVFLVCYFCTFSYAVVTILVNGSNDYSYISYLIKIPRSILCYVFLLMITYNILQPSVLFRKFFIMYVMSCCLYILVTTLMIFHPDIRLFWQEYLYTTKINEELSEMSQFITRYGWSGFSGFMHTYMCSIGVILILFLMDYDKKSYKMALLCVLIGNLYYGRSGVVLSLFYIIINFITETKLRKFIMLTKLIFCILLLSCSIYLAKDSLPEIGLWISWAMDPVENVMDSFENGTISLGYSADHMLEDMYFMPEDTTFLFGDGRYMNSDNSYYQNTDVGVMRSMLFYGVIGQALGYSNLIILLFILYEIFRRNKNKSGKIMVYMLLIQFVIFELKGDPYYYLSGIVSASILAFSHDYMKTKKERIVEYD